MITAWIAFGLATSTALCVAGFALEQLLRSRRCSTRWVWIAAMTGPLFLAFGGPWSSAPQSSASTQPVVRASSLRYADLTPLPHIHLAHRAHSLAQEFDLDRIVAIAWACSSGALVLVLALSSAYVRRRAHESMRIFGENLVVADALGPAVFGIVRPRIVVPRWFLALDAATQRTALVHERQHIAAHDSRLLGAGLFLLVAMPWNVPLWWQLRRLRLAIEVDCDARVLRCGLEPHAYGMTLLRVAEHRSSKLLFAPSMNDTAAALEQRVKLLFAPQLLLPKRVAAVLVICVIGGTVAAAQIDPPADISTPRVTASAAAGTATPNRASRALGRGLIEAIQSNDAETARVLIAEGADVNRVALGDGTPLILAARNGDVELVRHLLDHSADPNLASPGDGNPLIVAAAYGRLDIAVELIQRGADVNAIVIGDETPLINAARRGHFAVADHLVRHGADVNLSVPESSRPLAEIRSPLSEAHKYRRRDIVRFLEAKGASSR